MRRSTIVRLLASTALIGLTASTTALAQSTAAPPAQPADEQPATSIDDIIVTAQRRSESIQDVPIAITVVSADQLDRQQVTELRDLSRTAAGLEFGAAGGANPGGGASIRGLGTTAFTRAAEAAVGVVVDNVVQGNANIDGLFDVSRVEVLRGPQGTLFGQSVSAGVINITTTKPNPGQIEGKASIELSGDGVLGSEIGRQVSRAAVNLPLSETSAVRVSLFDARTQGTTRNVLLGKDEEQEESGIRARYLNEISDAVTVNIIGDYSEVSLQNGGFFVYGGVTPGTNAARFNAACGVVPSLENYNYCSDFESASKRITRGLSGEVEADLGSLTLTAITAYRRQTFGLVQDIDRLPESVTTLNIGSSSDTSVRQITQEVRLASNWDGPFSFVLGGYYQNSQTVFDNPGDRGASLYFARAGLPGPPVLNSRTAQYLSTDLDNLSAFGEGRYEFGSLTVFAGARVNRNTIGAFARLRPTAPALGALTYRDFSFEDTDVSWRIGAQYDLTEQAMLYGTISRGYKSGQIAPELAAGQIIQPEKPMDFQAGVKTNLFDRRIAVNAAVFYTQVNDFQASKSTINAGTGVVSAAPFNIPEVVSKGVEVEIFGRLTDSLSLNGGFLYNDARYPDDFLAQNGGQIGGQQIAFAPRYKATLSGEYVRSLGGDLEGFINVDVTYRSAQRLGIESNSDTFNFYKANTVVGARIGARVSDRWSLALYARNIGDVAQPYSIGQLPQPLGDAPLSSRHVYQSANSHRQIGLQANLDF